MVRQKSDRHLARGPLLGLILYSSEAPGAFWPFGKLLCRSGRILGGSWAVLGTEVGRPGYPWRHLGGVLLGRLRSEEFFSFGLLF